jgi:hypothetical protein
MYPKTLLLAALLVAGLLAATPSASAQSGGSVPGCVLYVAADLGTAAYVDTGRKPPVGITKLPGAAAYVRCFTSALVQSADVLST